MQGIVIPYPPCEYEADDVHCLKKKADGDKHFCAEHAAEIDRGDLSHYPVYRTGEGCPDGETMLIEAHPDGNREMTRERWARICVATAIDKKRLRKKRSSGEVTCEGSGIDPMLKKKRLEDASIQMLRWKGWFRSDRNCFSFYSAFEEFVDAYEAINGECDEYT